MSETREYRMLSDWYEDLATIWLKFADELRIRVGDTVTWREPNRIEQWICLAKECSFRAARYARLAEKAKTKTSNDLTNVTPIKATKQ